MANNEKLHIEVTADTSRVTRGMDAASRELRKMERLVQQAGTTMEKAFSPAQLKGIQAYKTGLEQSRQKMAGFKLQQMAIQGEFMNLASSTDKYGGNTKKLMGDIEQLGLKDKKAKEAMINNDKRVHASFYRTIGAVMARSTQASAVSENFTRMKNPLYSVNKPLLGIANGLENIAKKGQPAYLALKMLGPNASMKDLQKMQRTIAAGQMRLQGVFLVSAVAAGIFYTALHKGAMDTNKAYAKAFKDMAKTVREAVQPLVDVFAAMMVPVFKAVTAVGKMVIAFNKAHPTISKLIAAFLVLIPALTLILSPLAVGIGLLGGFKAAMAALWMVIGPTITGFAAMMGTVLVVAAVIVGAGYLIYKNWDKIKAFMLPIFETIKAKAVTAFNNMKVLILKAVDAVVKFAVPIWGKIVDALKQMWSSAQPIIMRLSNYIRQAFTAISKFIASVMPTVVDIIKGAWEFIQVVIEFAVKHILPLVTSAFSSIMKIISSSMDFIVPLIKNSWNFMKVLITSALGIIKNVIGFVMNIINGNWKGAWDNIKNILKLAWDVVKAAVAAAIKFVQIILDKGMALIKSLWKNGWDIIKKLVATTWDIIKQLFGKAITALWTKMLEFKDYIVKKFEELKTAAIGKIKALWTDVKFRFVSAARDIYAKVMGFTRNVVNKFNELKDGAIDKFKTMKTDLKTKFDEIVTDLVAKAKALPGKIGEGISNAAKDAAQGVKDLGAKIIDTFKEKLGIHSPSRVFASLGKYVIEGLKNGLSWENIKKFATNIFGDVTDGALGTFNTIQDFFSGNSLSGIKSFFGGIAGFAGDAFGSVKDMFSGTVGVAGSGVQQWSAVATKALMMTGQFSKANLDRLLYQMQTESGGNAKAINLWDINAKNGVPSKGLMQVIDPTFAAYKMPGYNDIWNPLDNILASIRYAVSRYGSLGNAYRGVGYATGGIFNGSKDGVMAKIAEGHGNEAVVPLSNKTRMKPFAHAVAAMMPDSGGSAREDVNVTYEFTIPVEIDGRVVAQATAKFTQKELDKMARQKGRQMGQA
ncbi:transglycosylase SLT domain-containing protein [Exiguobacterium aurantiacum]|uniref:transglycosylase SLT domain-containing protein n=1 Tax=Exiguobacterium aurantiacum TaxID=33987 RepID=UPI00384C8E97